MNKGLSLLAAAWCLAGAVTAQNVATDSLRVQDDSSDFTFTESQLDEDSETSQVVSSIVAAKSDLFLSNVGYTFSPMRFRVRAYDNMYANVYMNGLMLNSLELGRFSYGMIGGMNDAVRNQEGVDGFEANKFGYNGVAGGTNINTRASQFATGNKLVFSACNRNYVGRLMFTHASGLNANGWAYAFSVGYRGATTGLANIDGTFYNSLSAFLSVQKVFNDNHSLNLVAFGAPTERAQQGASTEEAYWLANSHYYNPYWGYQNGKVRNSRVVHDFTPTAILTWDWNIGDKRDKKLVTSAGFKYSMYSNSRLTYTGNAYNPAPDYYKNFPSSIFNVYDDAINSPDFLQGNPFLLDQYNTLVDYWTSDKANRQIKWDQLYEVNRQSEAEGGETLYYVERNHNDERVLSLSSTFTHDINTQHHYALGLYLASNKGLHYKTMDDMLGGTRFTDVDSYAVRDYGRNSPMAQSDMRNPNRQIKEGDTFGYNYNTYVNRAMLWGQYHWNSGIWAALVAAKAEGTTMEREGLMQNGRGQVEIVGPDGLPMPYDNSYGKSGRASFLGGGAKASLAVRPTGSQSVRLSAFYNAQAPLVRNAFVAPRIQNSFVNNLTLEKIYGAELAYSFRFGDFSGKVSGYYTRFADAVEQTAFYNDQESRFTYLTMSGIEREHYGVEAAFEYQFSSNFSLYALGSIGDAKYTNNPLAQAAYEGMDAKTTVALNKWNNPIGGGSLPLMVIAEGMRVNGTPLTAACLGAKYNTNGWFFEAKLNYYDRVYIGYSAYRRLSNVLANYTATSISEQGLPVFGVSQEQLESEGGILFDGAGQMVGAYSPKQEKCDGGFMLDLSIGRYLRLKHGRSLSINLSLNNVTNNRNLCTGGYEQNRDDFYETGEAKAYKFSRNNKYYYANAFNFFLNIGYKF